MLLQALLLCMHTDTCVSRTIIAGKSLKGAQYITAQLANLLDISSRWPCCPAVARLVQSGMQQRNVLYAHVLAASAATGTSFGGL